MRTGDKRADVERLENRHSHWNWTEVAARVLMRTPQVGIMVQLAPVKKYGHKKPALVRDQRGLVELTCNPSRSPDRTERD